MKKFFVLILSIVMIVCVLTSCYSKKSNIEINEVEKKVCEHKSFAIRDAVSATADENGYTGDKYCLNCKKLLEKGRTIDKIGGSDEESSENSIEASETESKPSQTIEPFTKAKAEKLLEAWTHAAYFGTCCNFATASEEARDAMTDYQTSNAMQPYRIDCCDTFVEAQEHAKQFLTEAMFDKCTGFDEKNYFTFVGVLHFAVIPAGFDALAMETLEIIDNENGTYVMKIRDCNIDGLLGQWTFKVVYENGNYKIADSSYIF